MFKLPCNNQTWGTSWEILAMKWRLALVEAKHERFKLTTRRAGMRCQALLSEYEDDEEFCGKIRSEIAKVLQQRLEIAAEYLDLEVAQSTLRAAVSLQCDVAPMLKPAGALVLSLVGSSARCQQPVLDGVDGLAKAANRPLESFCDLTPLVRPVVQKVFREVQLANQASDETLPNLVKKVVGVRSNLKRWSLAEDFDTCLWDIFEPWYRELKTGSLEKRTAAAEFAIAYTEQLKISVPKWLLDKDQVTVLRLLKEAVESGKEQALREAVVAAKQTDFTGADESLSSALTSKYEEALGKLRHLKRLPSGWEVTDLVGDDASMKMFKKADLDDPSLKEKFQHLFDKTMKASIVTRDRAARGAGEMPRGYRVEKIVSVMNAESWKSYQERQDFIARDCLRYPGCAPMSDAAWADWSGKVHTAAHGNAIMEGAHLPSLNAGANEFLMFHGTKPEAADLIAMNHFDMAFACKTGLFGAGLYFAENSSKSDECPRDPQGLMSSTELLIHIRGKRIWEGHGGRDLLSLAVRAASESPVYDLDGSAEIFVLNQLLRPLGTGIFHCGVQVLGQEWSFRGGRREGSGAAEIQLA
eukprot:s478_g6.t1